MIDIFRPRHNPAQLIYDAFQEEAEKRKGREHEKWLQCERLAVLRAARTYWPTLPLEVVERAEIYAEGHVDYGAKWAYRLCELAEKHQGPGSEPGPLRRP